MKDSKGFDWSAASHKTTPDNFRVGVKLGDSGGRVYAANSFTVMKANPDVFVTNRPSEN